MRFNRLIILLLSILGYTSNFAAEANIPDHWYKKTQTANEIGITSFSQSPYLDGKNLLPMAARLADDPTIIELLENNGK